MNTYINLPCESKKFTLYEFILYKRWNVICVLTNVFMFYDGIQPLADVSTVNK